MTCLAKRKTDRKKEKNGEGKFILINIYNEIAVINDIVEKNKIEVKLSFAPLAIPKATDS